MSTNSSSMNSISSTSTSADVEAESPESGGSPTNSQAGVADEVCAVCGDTSTGLHYGTPSCNGCKTFFRRTIMRNQTFVCQYEGNCPVDKSVRCACRYCRFQKCLSVGMSKEAIQQNRDPIGYTKRTRRHQSMLKQPSPAPPTTEGILNLSSSAQTVGGFSFGNSSHRPTMTSSSSSGGMNLESNPNHEQMSEDLMLQGIIHVESLIPIVRNSKMNISRTLIECILGPSIFFDQQAMHQFSLESTYTSDVLHRAQHSDFLFWHERDWLIMVEWAKTIPMYQNLQLGDKLALLRHSAITFPSLIQCYYSPNKGPETIVFPNGAYFDKEDDPICIKRKNFKMLDTLLSSIRKLEIDVNEFAAAKAVFFLNPDSDELSPYIRGLISRVRVGITNALYRHMLRKRGQQKTTEIFSRLLLLGTVIATMSCEMKESVVVADFFKTIDFSVFTQQLIFGLSNHCGSSVTDENLRNALLSEGHLMFPFSGEKPSASTTNECGHGQTSPTFFHASQTPVINQPNPAVNPHLSAIDYSISTAHQQFNRQQQLQSFSSAQASSVSFTAATSSAAASSHNQQQQHIQMPPMPQNGAAYPFAASTMNLPFPYHLHGSSSVAAAAVSVDPEIEVVSPPHNYQPQLLLHHQQQHFNLLPQEGERVPSNSSHQHQQFTINDLSAASSLHSLQNFVLQQQQQNTPEKCMSSSSSSHASLLQDNLQQQNIIVQQQQNPYHHHQQQPSPQSAAVQHQQQFSISPQQQQQQLQQQKTMNLFQQQQQQFVPPTNQLTPPQSNHSSGAISSFSLSPSMYLSEQQQLSSS